MYSTVEEIRLMLKEHVLEDMISNQYMEDEAKKEQETIKIVTDAIEDADSEIDGYIAHRFPLVLPLSTNIARILLSTTLCHVPGLIRRSVRATI